MSDVADFDKDYLFNTVWGDYCTCLVCGAKTLQTFDHVTGRGGKRFRRIHSSPYNACPICADCHTNKNSRNIGEILVIIKAQLELVEHENTVVDEAFLEKYQKYYL